MHRPSLLDRAKQTCEVLRGRGYLPTDPQDDSAHDLTFRVSPPQFQGGELFQVVWLGSTMPFGDISIQRQGAAPNETAKSSLDPKATADEIIAAIERLQKHL